MLSFKKEKKLHFIMLTWVDDNVIYRQKLFLNTALQLEFCK